MTFHRRPDVIKTLPFYELDRVILSCFDAPNPGTHDTANVVRKVRRQLKSRGIALTTGQVFQRILQIHELGSLSMAGDTSRWRQHGSFLRTVELLDD
jgi:hypothetical protein